MVSRKGRKQSREMYTSFLTMTLLTILTLKTAQTKPLKDSFDPPDASLLQVASIKDMALKQGRIYKKEPDFKFRLQNVSHEARENHFCPSYVELTIDLNRRPAIVLQTQCDCQDCRAYGDLESSGVCREMMYFKAVEVRGKGHLYQAFANSCYCDLVKNILHLDSMRFQLLTILWAHVGTLRQGARASQCRIFATL